MEMTKQLESHLTANMNISKKDIIIGNFLGGIAWGIGTVFGALIIGALLFWLLKPLGIFNGLNETAKELENLKNIQQNLPQTPQNYR